MVSLIFGRLAQLVEQLTFNQRVVGSIPTAPTRDSERVKIFRHTSPHLCCHCARFLAKVKSFEWPYYGHLKNLTPHQFSVNIKKEKGELCLVRGRL